MYPSHGPLISVLNYLYRFPSVLFLYLRKVIILAFYAGMKGVGSRQSQEISSGKRQENWKLRAMDTHLSTSPFFPSSFSTTSSSYLFFCLFRLDSSGQLVVQAIGGLRQRIGPWPPLYLLLSTRTQKKCERTYTFSRAFEPEMPVCETKFALYSTDTRSNSHIAMVEGVLSFAMQN